MITITDTITIVFITIAFVTIAISPGQHTPTIGGKQAADSAGKSESEICSPQDPIVYLSCRI
jgi:hypothetical protein